MGVAPDPKPFAGLNLADDLREFEVEAPKARPDRAALAAVSQKAGFPSREPKPAKPEPAPREVNYESRLTIRVSEKDAERFRTLCWKLRAANGDVFGRLLDTFEAQQP